MACSYIIYLYAFKWLAVSLYDYARERWSQFSLSCDDILAPPGVTHIHNDKPTGLFIINAHHHHDTCLFSPLVTKPYDHSRCNAILAIIRFV